MILKRKRFVWKLNLCWKKLKSNNFGQNFILVRQNFLVGIFFWSENNFGLNFFWFKYFVGWREKIVGQKIILVGNSVGWKSLLDLKWAEQDISIYNLANQKGNKNIKMHENENLAWMLLLSPVQIVRKQRNPFVSWIEGMKGHYIGS